MTPTRLNLGCGRCPRDGWVNESSARSGPILRGADAFRDRARAPLLRPAPARAGAIGEPVPAGVGVAGAADGGNRVGRGAGMNAESIILSALAVLTVCWMVRDGLRRP